MSLPKLFAKAHAFLQGAFAPAADVADLPRVKIVSNGFGHGTVLVDGKVVGGVHGVRVELRPGLFDRITLEMDAESTIVESEAPKVTRKTQRKRRR